MRIGVLALQGAFGEHEAMLRCLGAQTRQVRLPQDLEGLDGLIIPGGESTTIGKLLVAYHLRDPIKELAQDDFPIYGTCAGMILLAKRLAEGDQPLVGVMDILVQRNAFGRQVDSFEADLELPALGPEPFHTVFIRAPLIQRVEPGVEVLGTLPQQGVVAAREGNLLVSAFHPELTQDSRFHRYFLNMVAQRQAGVAQSRSQGVLASKDGGAPQG